jgi:hypothetical protein
MSPDTIKNEARHLSNFGHQDLSSISQNSPDGHQKNLIKNNITLAIVSQESLEYNRQQVPSHSPVKQEMPSLNLDKLRPKIVPIQFANKVNQHIINFQEN